MHMYHIRPRVGTYPLLQSRNVLCVEQLNIATFLVPSQSGTWDAYVSDSNLDDFAFSLGSIAGYGRTGRDNAEFQQFNSVRGVYVQCISPAIVCAIFVFIVHI